MTALRIDEADLLKLGMGRVNIVALREMVRILVGSGGTVTLSLSDIESLSVSVRNSAAPIGALERRIANLESIVGV